MTPRRRREFHATLGGALVLLAVVGIVWSTISIFRQPQVNYTPPSADGSLIFTESSGMLAQPVITLSEDSTAPAHFIDVHDPKTGHHVVGIDRDGSLHPDWRRKFKLLRKRCIRGCCTGDVREGRRSRVGH